MRDYNKELHWFNFPDLEPKLYATWLRNLMLSVGYDIRKFGKPTYLYQYNGFITELDNITHSPSAIAFLNTTGIDFYLNEPLCTRTLSQESRFDNVINVEDVDLRADELESIKDYVVRNSLTDVTVHVGDYNIEHYASHYLPYMKLIVDDIFFYSTQYVEPKDTRLQTDIKFKFVNLNKRYTDYRHIVASFLKDKSTRMSWFHERSLPSKSDWYDLSNWDYKITDDIGIRIVDQSIDSVNQSSVELETVYKECYCDIVAESRFTSPLGNISEKTIRPAMYKKPFVLVAPYKTLEYIKTLGFKTFSDFWDESYDDCENHEERLKKVLTLIDYIDNMSLNDLRLLLERMEPILDHNFENYKKIARFGQDKS